MSGNDLIRASLVWVESPTSTVVFRLLDLHCVYGLKQNTFMEDAKIMSHTHAQSTQLDECVCWERRSLTSYGRNLTRNIKPH